MLPFICFPELAKFKNNRSSINHDEFVEEAIGELVESGRVIETTVPPLVVNLCLYLFKPMAKRGSF